jgi:hypothetical protein
MSNGKNSQIVSRVKALGFLAVIPSWYWAGIIKAVSLCGSVPSVAVDSDAIFPCGTMHVFGRERLFHALPTLHAHIRRCKCKFTKALPDCGGIQQVPLGIPAYVGRVKIVSTLCGAALERPLSDQDQA